MKNIFILTWLCVVTNGNLYSQERQLNSLQEVVDYHLNEFKKSIKNDQPKIRVLVDFEKDILKGHENVLQVDSGINPKSLKRKETHFVVKFLLCREENGVKVRAVNYAVYKQSRIKLTFSNLGSGQIYKIK